jgi:hypothetical protein
MSVRYWYDEGELFDTDSQLTTSKATKSPDDALRAENEALKKRVRELEAELARVKGDSGGGH